jgi:hypothetical protein
VASNTNSVASVPDLYYFTSTQNNFVSSLVLSSTGSHQNGAYVNGQFSTDRPLRISSYGVAFNTEPAQQVGTVRVKIAFTVNGGDAHSGVTTNTGSGTLGASPPFLPAKAGDRVWYGYRQQNSLLVRARRNDQVRTLSTDGFFVSGNQQTTNGQLAGFVATRSVPSAPTNFQLTGITHSTASFSWGLPIDEGGGAESVTGYRILYNDGIGWQSSGTISGRTTNTYTLVGLQPNTSYTFLIAAINSVCSLHGGSGTAQTTGPNTAVGGNTKIPVRHVWNGSSFVSGVERVWNGTSFISTTANASIWNGTSWIDSK